jgi:hypothetical protein
MTLFGFSFSLSSWRAVVLMYAAAEFAFYLTFYYYLVPKANGLTEPARYRDYDRDRHKLLLRIMHRIERTCKLSGDDVKQTLVKFLREWFHLSKNPLFDQNSHPDLQSTTSSSPENSDDDSSDVSTQSHCLCQEDITEFFAWAFFGKNLTALIEWEQEELQRLFDIMEEHHPDLKFPPRATRQENLFYYQCKARCMTLEPVKAFHRPFLVYVIVYLVKIIGSLLLYYKGYRRCVASTGLVAWHRPAANKNSCLLPMLFFHGIAPGGLMLYLPMLLRGLVTESDRPILFFENRSISCEMDFQPLTEEATVEGVLEILQRFHYDSSKAISLVGHSFGSCPITWLLSSKRLSNVKQVVLLDPVTILLSEPDVMVNFLYAEEISKIRMVASSELFTEYYLRRHFAWYNSELWLADIDKDCHVLVCLAEKDEILNASIVKREVERHSSVQKSRILFWERAGHADCVTSSTKWEQIKQAMLEQELLIAQEG